MESIGSSIVYDSDFAGIDTGKDIAIFKVQVQLEAGPTRTRTQMLEHVAALLLSNLKCKMKGSH